MPWTEEPGRLQSIGSQRVGHWSDLARTQYVPISLKVLVYPSSTPLSLWELLVNFIYFFKGFFFFFFWFGPFVKVFIEFVTTLLLFYVWVFRWWGMWDLKLPNQGLNSQTLNWRMSQPPDYQGSPRNYKLKTAEIYCLTALGNRQNQDALKATLPLKVLRGSLPCFSQFLVTLGISWLVAGQICSCLHKLSSLRLCVPISFSFLW